MSRPAAGRVAHSARAQPSGPARGPVRCCPTASVDDGCCLHDAPLSTAYTVLCLAAYMLHEQPAALFRPPLGSPCPTRLTRPPTTTHPTLQCTCASSACCTWPTSTAWSSRRCPPWTSCSSATCPRSSDKGLSAARVHRPWLGAGAAVTVSFTLRCRGQGAAPITLPTPGSAQHGAFRWVQRLPQFDTAGAPGCPYRPTPAATSASTPCQHFGSQAPT